MRSATIYVVRRDVEDKTQNKIAIELGDQRIVISSPHDVDDLIISLIKARNAMWPLPKIKNNRPTEKA